MARSSMLKRALWWGYAFFRGVCGADPQVAAGHFLQVVGHILATHRWLRESTPSLPTTAAATSARQVRHHRIIDQNGIAWPVIVVVGGPERLGGPVKHLLDPLQEQSPVLLA